MNTTRDTTRQIITLLALIAVIAVNALANILPINDVTTGELSDSFDVLFVPAGYVFAIWGLIYLGLIAYAIYQLLPSKKRNPVLQKIAPWFLLNCVANIAWIFLWHYRFVFESFAAMALILITLIIIYVRLGIGRIYVPNSERFFVHFPFSIYLAWITVATIANATVVLFDNNWDGFGLSAETWAVIMIIVAALVTALMSIRHADVAFVGVVVWALIGISVEQSDTLIVAIAAGIMVVFVLLSLLIGSAIKKDNKGVSFKLS